MALTYQQKLKYKNLLAPFMYLGHFSEIEKNGATLKSNISVILSHTEIVLTILKTSWNYLSFIIMHYEIFWTIHKMPLSVMAKSTVMWLVFSRKCLILRRFDAWNCNWILHWKRRVYKAQSTHIYINWKPPIQMQCKSKETVIVRIIYKHYTKNFV